MSNYLFRRLSHWVFGDPWVARHKTGAQLEVWARSRRGAERKVRRWIQDTMFGDWALTYSPEAVDRVMGEITLSPRDVESLLMPCPFCGSRPMAYIGDPGAPYPGGYFTIECVNQECQADACVSLKRRTDLSGLSLAEAEAAIWPEIREIWNRRASGNAGR